MESRRDRSFLPQICPDERRWAIVAPNSREIDGNFWEIVPCGRKMPAKPELL